MDDSCAVCAETLEWAAYGQCGHREVCSTCVTRLRFICDDHCCCICKSNSDIIFVTKALGDYTKVISDFSVFPSEPTEGTVGSYWYHEGTQAFFDDSDQYKMIKAMCRLSCFVCDKIDEQGNGSPKVRVIFRNVDQLKDHLFYRHKRFMCNLCLEGRKIFICEQKLYNREQLNQHINTGDSEVDGSETERGGFTGHPMCEFCENPFYGENELYTHMSTEHYTCHICQRQHPGIYEYYRNYDELENHFRRDHILCEDEECLAKKFIVFTCESEMKRHNALEHGGRMSRSKRNTVLQIPTSFRYERNIEQDRRRRGHGVQLNYSEGDFSTALEANPETTDAPDISRATSCGVRDNRNRGTAVEVDSRFSPLELLATSDFESSSRYHLPQGQRATRTTPLEESSFPPLPRKNQQKSKNKSGKSTMAARLRRQNNVNVLHSSRAGPTIDHQPTPAITNFTQPGPTPTSGYAPGPSSVSAGLSSASASSAKGKPAHEQVSTNSKRSTSTGTLKVNNSALAPTNFPPVSVTSQNLTINGHPLVKVDDARAANKSLVEKIRADLQFDDDRYTVFKVISGEFRQGLIETGEYVAYVHQFGLSHLIPELAKLCPDPQKQKELFEACKTSLRSNGPSFEFSNNNSRLKQDKISKKGKEKLEGNEANSSKNSFADSIISSIRELQLSRRPSGEEVEILSKDGYRSGKGKSKILVDEGVTSSLTDQTSSGNAGQNDIMSAGSSSKKTVGGNKARKKTSKFHRVRLGEESPAALLGVTSSEPTPDLPRGKTNRSNGSSKKFPVSGAWQNGGGRKLVANLR